MERFVVCLRTHSVKNYKSLYIQDKNLSELILESEDLIDEDQISSLLKQFAEDVRLNYMNIVALAESEFDVYVNYCADQGTFIFPVEFLALISELKLPIIIDFND